MKHLLLIILITMLIFLSGCAMLRNNTVTYTKYGPGPVDKAKILNTWVLSVPAKSNVDIDPVTGKIIYTGKVAGVFENVKDLLMLKAVQTDVSVSNQPGK